MKIGSVDTEIAFAHSKKTRNVWQSLAYSPLGATVSPPDRRLLYTVDSRKLWRYQSEAHQIYIR